MTLPARLFVFIVAASIAANAQFKAPLNPAVEPFSIKRASTFAASPAGRVHLRFGDKIVDLDGEKVSGKSSDVVRDHIRGETGTTFRMTVQRASTNRLETVEIRRGRVAQPSIPDAYILRPAIGYIDLSEGFNYTTSDEFDAAF